MQCSRSKHLHRHRVQIVTFGIAFLVSAVLPLACASPAMAATLDRMRQTGKITLGYRADARPFAYRDEIGNADGYAVALCKEVAARLKSDQ
jgi:ABC-type amino acid transport substrate-binding protein